MTQQRFTCTPDTMVKGVTLFFWIGMLAGAAIVGTVAGALGILQWLLVLLMLGTPLAVMAQAPRAYRIADGTLFVERLIGDIAVPMTAIAEVRRLEMADFGRMIRTFGSGGAHGYFGRFRSDKLGKLNFQATRREGLVLVARNDSAPALVLSPDDPAGLEAALARR